MKHETHSEDQDVQQSVQTRALEDRLSSVLHQLCIPASEDHDSEAPLSVPENTATQQHLVVVDGVGLPVQDQCAFEFSEIVVWSLAANLSSEL